MSSSKPTLNEAPLAYDTIGRYRLIQRVGEGAFAEVYFARDEESLAPVAVKVLKDDIDPSIREQVRVRFLAEEKITRAIQHPYVIHIRETSAADARPCFLAMDFVAGWPFNEHLARFRAGRLTSEKPGKPEYMSEVARLGHQVASAMASAHARGIVHRDLKPENVLVSCEHDALAEVRILDFGIAKAPVELFSVAAATSVTRYWTELGTVMGSPPCMAPEQCGAAQAVSGKADVFALGVMLFGALLGVDIQSMEQSSSQLDLPQDLENSIALRGPLPQGWETLLRAMLELDPETRPDMAEVALRLQRLARSDEAFGAAVEAWVRQRRVPSARQLGHIMTTVDEARYLTEDERDFAKNAPLKRLASMQSRLAFATTAATLAGVLVLGGAALAASGWLGGAPQKLTLAASRPLFGAPVASSPAASAVLVDAASHARVRDAKRELFVERDRAQKAEALVQEGRVEL
ncbi:MAG TPA: serine/threonine-protein kinase, partial [Polyangiaceae bacterium]|nr:serine/threonine-protein kinase [Polyangiaceae bacterium]